MEKSFKIGDIVIYPIKNKLYFGTIISFLENECFVDTHNTPIKIKDLVAAELPFKVDAVVKVKENLKPNCDYGRVNFAQGMIPFRGKIFSITKITREGMYKLDGCKDYNFSPEMLEFPIKKGDLVVLRASVYHSFPELAGKILIVEDILNNGKCYVLNDGKCSIQGVKFCPSSLTKVSDGGFVAKYLGDKKVEINNTIFDLNDLNNENQLQRKDSSVVRGERPEGSRIYGRRPTASISIRPLSNKARIGFSQS